MNIERQPDSVTATIANGQTTSGAIRNSHMAFGGFIIPAAFTGASVSFTVCDTVDGTYVPLYDADNALVSITVGTSRGYPLPAELAGFKFFKIVSASAEGGARTIVVALKA